MHTQVDEGKRRTWHNYPSKYSRVRGGKRAHCQAKKERKRGRNALWPGSIAHDCPLQQGRKGNSQYVHFLYNKENSFLLYCMLYLRSWSTFRKDTWWKIANVECTSREQVYGFPSPTEEIIPNKTKHLKRPLLCAAKKTPGGILHIYLECFPFQLTAPLCAKNPWIFPPFISKAYFCKKRWKILHFHPFRRESENPSVRRPWKQTRKKPLFRERAPGVWLHRRGAAASQEYGVIQLLNIFFWQCKHSHPVT